MFSLSQDFHRARLDRNRRPLTLFALTNAFGVRVWADRQPTDQAMGLVSPPLADGVFLADGMREAGNGSLNLLEAGARVLSYGRLRETLTPKSGELLASYGQEEPGSLTVVLANRDPGGARPLSRLEALENLVGASGALLMGYEGLLARDFLPRFAGKVASYRLEPERLSLTVRA